MFQSARLKLTGWYLIIIMLISLSFSVAIYRVLTSEVYRFSSLQRTRIEQRLLNQGLLPPGTNISLPPPPGEIDSDLMMEVEYRLILRLVIVNGIILVISGGLGYMLAGRTLKPIAEMVDEQNRFISDASHELRTPLTALKSSIEVNLRDKKMSLDEAKQVLKENVTQVNKLQTLSDSLLELTQYQSPGNHIPHTSVLIEDVIDNAVERITPLAKAKQITVDHTVPHVKIIGNKENLSDLFVILLDNAIKYSNTGTKIGIGAKKTDGHINIWVKDHGMGIASKDLPHIFDRFYREDSARGRAEEGGYGLGLSIAKKIVDAHHGTIAVISKPNAGTTFTIKLPRGS